MLVLSRKVGERIIIGNHFITIMLVEVKGPDRAKLGIDAPDELCVHREEVFERIKHREEQRGVSK